MDYDQEMDEYIESHMSHGRKTFRKCLKYAFRVLVFSIIGLLLWRVFLSDRIPKDMKTLLVNDATYEAYVAEGEDVRLYTQTQDKLIVNGDTAGYFWVSQAVFVPEAAQVQILVRYNNSTLDHIAEDFKLDSVPAREEKVIDVTLRVRGAEGEELRVHATGEPVSDSTSMYNYRKYIFDGVSVDDATAEIFVDFYYAERVDYEKLPYGTLLVYDAESDDEPLRLKARDKKALAAWGDR